MWHTRISLFCSSTGMSKEIRFCMSFLSASSSSPLTLRMFTKVWLSGTNFRATYKKETLKLTNKSRTFQPVQNLITFLSLNIVT